VDLKIRKFVTKRPWRFCILNFCYWHK